MPDWYADIFVFLIFSGVAKPSKKVKRNKRAEDSNPSEPEKQLPEASRQTAEATIDEPPPEEHDITI